MWRSRSVSKPLVFFLVAYAAAGTGVTTMVFGTKLTGLMSALLQRNADLRFCLVRSRENAETIAFFSGEAHELHVARTRMSLLVETLRENILWSRHLAIFTNSYNYMTIVLPGLIIAPRYFAGEVEFGVISQTGFAFNTILAALTLIVDRIAELSALTAQVGRLDELLDALLAEGVNSSTNTSLSTKSSADAHTSALQRSQSAEHTLLETRELVLYRPYATTPMWQPLNTSVATGQRLLIMGPSGCGKSTLLRAIAGLWRWGTGSIATLPLDDCAFISQKPYMALGTLRENLHFGRRKHDPEQAATDKQLEHLLTEVGLEGLLERVGGLDVEMPWSDVLSLGEQQRVAFGRIFLHGYKYACCDEASAALDEVTESRLYSLLAQRMPSYISVGHRRSLLKHHTHVLRLVTTGDLQALEMQETQNTQSMSVINNLNQYWVFSTVQEFQQHVAQTNKMLE